MSEQSIGAQNNFFFKPGKPVKHEPNFPTLQTAYRLQPQNVYDNSPSKLQIFQKQQPPATVETSIIYKQFKKVLAVSYNQQRKKKKEQLIVENMMGRIRNIQQGLEELHNKISDSQSIIQPPKKNIDRYQPYKKPRRTAEEIQKKWKCQVPCCKKYYGTEASMNQHIKLKHPYYNRKLIYDPI